MRKLKGYNMISKVCVPSGVRLTGRDMEFYNQNRDKFVFATGAKAMLAARQNKRYDLLVWAGVYKHDYVSVFRIKHKQIIPF